MSLTIVKPGLLTTVQDLGRYGAQQYGVNVGGAMDALALRLANLLVGNAETAAGLEITMLGPEIGFERPTLISVCGGDLAPTLNGRALPLWTTALAPAGGVLRFGPARLGCRAYLAAAGGVDVPVRMNSRSTNLRAGFGGWEGRALREGDRLPLGEPAAVGRRMEALLSGEAQADGGVAAGRWSVAPELVPAYGAQPEVRAVAGQELELFDADSVARFFGERYTVRAESDRMGYRLSGATLRLAEPVELVSSAVTFGTVQVPPDGQPIVLMADRQTTGGYPKIAQVVSADWPLLAQASLGGTVRFRLVSLHEAQRLYLKQERSVRMLREGLRHMLDRHNGRL